MFVFNYLCYINIQASEICTVKYRRITDLDKLLFNISLLN